jgi:coenzyme F420-reducing hydrogenase gamma subunit
MREWFMFICLLMLCFGCARTMTDFAPFASDSVTSQTEEEMLLTTGDVDRPYKELGVIFVKGRCARYEKIVEKLKARAKEVGADAVIKIEFGKFRRSYRRQCRGVAVSFE